MAIEMSPFSMRMMIWSYVIYKNIFLELKVINLTVEFPELMMPFPRVLGKI